MVDPGDEVVDLLGRDAEVGGQLARGVPGPSGTARRCGSLLRLGDGPAEHRHRVDVLQQQRVGAELLHVAADVEQHRDRPQAAHDPADAERVGDRLAQPVALRDLEVDDGRRPVAADLERGHDVVGAVERGAPVGRSPRRPRRRRAPRRGRAPTISDVAQPLGVDVHQRERRRVGELREAQHVADEVAGEDGRAGADERDPRHARHGGANQRAAASGGGRVSGRGPAAQARAPRPA